MPGADQPAPGAARPGPEAERRRIHADRLKERVYLTFVALAVVLALGASDDVSAWGALETVIVTTAGTLAAVFVADVIAHVDLHGRGMNLAELRHALLASFGAASAIGIPVVALLIALLGWWRVDVALEISAIGLIVSLAIIGYLGVRRIRMKWWLRLLALAAEALVGVVVVALQILAHG